MLRAVQSQSTAVQPTALWGPRRVSSRGWGDCERFGAAGGGRSVLGRGLCPRKLGREWKSRRSYTLWGLEQLGRAWASVPYSPARVKAAWLGAG